VDGTYLLIGHITQDVLPDGSLRAGGTATYAALAAARLGARVRVLTSGAFSQPPVLAADVYCRPAEATTTFENIYQDGQRRQYLRAQAAPLTPADLPTSWREAEIVHLGPVAQEVSIDFLGAFPGAFLGLTPQGWLRRWDDAGRVSVAPWEAAPAALAAADAVVLSLEDLGGDRALLADYRRWARLLVLTVGRDGAIVYHQGQERRLPAYLVQEVDPTGAGDVFAAAFFIRLVESGDPMEAARFANCAASFVVEGPGPSTIPWRAQVEERLRYGVLRA
jgi:1D-myo-inositol 3-kinase